MPIYLYIFKNNTICVSELKAIDEPSDEAVIIRRGSRNIMRLKKSNIGALLDGNSMYLLSRNDARFITSLWRHRNKEIREYESLIQAKKADIEVFRRLLNSSKTYENRAGQNT